MDKKEYIAAMQKIELPERFIEKTVSMIQNEDKLNYNVYKYKRNIQRKRMVKAAVIISVLFLSTTGISVAAAKLSIVDIFKGFFKQSVYQEANNKNIQQGESGIGVTTTPLTKDSEFIDKASALVRSTVTEKGLKLTARGIVGDGHNIYIAVDVETTDGSAFNKSQQSDVEDISFSKVWLKVNGDCVGQYCYITRVDDGSVKGKATFVLLNSLNIKGLDKTINHINIRFTNLRETCQDSIIDIGSQKSLQDIMNEIGEASQNDFDYMGCNSTIDGYMDWYRQKREQIKKELKEKGITYKEDADYDSYFGKIDKMLEEAIMKKGGFNPEYFIRRKNSQTTFCTKYPKLAISNIGIRYNQLVLKMEFNGNLNYDSLADAGILLVNKKNGSTISGVAGGGLPVNGNDDSQSDIKNNELISCSAQFSGISSKEELKDYYLAFGGRGKGSYKTLIEGDWNLDFNLNYKDTTRVYTIKKDITLGGIKRKLEQLSISPMSLQLEYSDSVENIDMENSNKSNSFGNGNTDIIKIVMRDDSEMKLASFGWDNDSLNVVLPAIIDLDKVKAVKINGQMILLN